jgi:hypothetical protein
MSPRAKRLSTSLEGSEHQHQVRLFAYAKIREAQEPAWGLLFAIPNAGGYVGGFRSNAARVVNMRREGVRGGVPDLCLPVPRGGFHGFYGELKVAKRKPTPAQIAWIEALNRQGYYAVVRHGWEAMKETIEAYLRLEPWIGTAHQEDL